MSSDAIYLLSDAGQLRRVEHQHYDNEDLLQRLIAQHPELLAGDQIDPEDPPRWLLLKREAGIPDADGAADRWSLDHLLLDQNGVPTLVEVKRSSDPRIRREVIGQMLDYIANAQVYWAASRMRQMLVEAVGSDELANEKLADHLRLDAVPDASVEELNRFWSRVETNLADGNVRLLFVADELPRELRRLIEFLNTHFTRVEVLGIELRQYIGEGVRALVPRVIGHTEATRGQKERPSAGRSSRTTTTREEFLASCQPETHQLFNAVLDGAAAAGYRLHFATKGFSLRLSRRSGGTVSIFYGYPPGSYPTAWPVLEAYDNHLQSSTARERLFALFGAVPQFKRVSPHLVRAVLDPAALPTAEAVLEALAAFAREFSRSESASGAQTGAAQSADVDGSEITVGPASDLN